MPQLLGPTNPVPGYDSAGNRGTPITPRDPAIQNIIDPTRAGRADGRSDRQDATGDGIAPSYDSNFQTFIQRLKDSPELREVFGQLLRQGLLVSSGLREGSAVEMAQFLELLRMDEGQLMSFLQNQLKSGARFGGALFGLLREAYFSSQSEAFRADVLQFLRMYSNNSSTAHIEQNLLRSLREMIRSLPASWADRLTTLTGQLQNGIAAGDRAGNLQLLREQIVPLMAEYVGKTHDLGRARDFLSRLTLDLIRYENGSEGNLIQAFRQLNNYGVLKAELGEISDQMLLRLLRETEFAKASANDAFARQFSELAERALKGQGGTALQDAFREIVSAMLVNESVYMPLNHVLLPLQWQDKAVFSEMWLDPDAENGSERGEKGVLRILLKLDVENLGLFDVLLNSKENRVSIQVACPERVARFSGVMASALREILTKNGLTADTVSVSAMQQPLAISQVFPKIFERKNSINVKI